MQYIRVHRNVSKALDLEDEEEILDLISEREDETERESNHSFLPFKHMKKVDAYDGTAYLATIIGYVSLGILLVLTKIQSRTSTLSFLHAAFFRGLILVAIGAL